MSDIIKAEYDGFEMTFNGGGWFDATQAALKFGKRPTDWLSLDSTKEYISLLCDIDRSEKSSLLKVKRGGKGYSDSTWMNPKLSVAFARWLDTKFAIWCDMQIDNIIHPKQDFKQLRHASAAGYKLMDNILQLSRKEQGKDTKHYHYSNEALLVNWALSGKRESINRDSLSYIELDILAKLQAKNTMLLCRDVVYEKRKVILEDIASELRNEVKFLMKINP